MIYRRLGYTVALDVPRDTVSHSVSCVPVSRAVPSVAVPQTKSRWGMRAAAVLLGLLVAFLLAEVAVRLMGQTDEDGNFFFRGKLIGAVHPQVQWVRRQMERYRQSDNSRMISDPDTGWSPRPQNVTHNGRYRYERHGIRTGSIDSPYRKQPAAGVLRIALFGDSFTHGDDVPFEESWGYLLERKLKAAGYRAEVVNFGVSAYGMDQAFLRWRFLGREFAPHIVLFGFQAENVNRNVNLLRGFYVLHTGIPFSKPRFVLEEDGRLRLINRPALPPDEVPRVMAHMDEWELSRYEWFYNPDDYRRRFWQRSRFLSLLMDRLTRQEEPGLSRPGPTLLRGGQPARLTRRILQEFRRDVQQQGGRFFVIHLPKKSDLQRLLRHRPLPDAGLWEDVSAEQDVIDPVPTLLKRARRDGVEILFADPKQAHYSRVAGELLSGRIFATLSAAGLLSAAR